MFIWCLVFGFPARYGKPQQAWARKDFLPTAPFAFSLQPFAFASLSHLYPHHGEVVGTLGKLKIPPANIALPWG
jgi:hypothetical protein